LMARREGQIGVCYNVRTKRTVCARFPRLLTAAAYKFAVHFELRTFMVKTNSAFSPFFDHFTALHACLGFNDRLIGYWGANRPFGERR
jgi:hypothetical protein